MCPPLVNYKQEFYDKAAKDLPNSSKETQQLITDYGKLRAACRSLKE